MAVFVATFLGTVALHTLWDSVGSGLLYLAVGSGSLGWLLVQLHRYRVPRAPLLTPTG